MHFIVISDFFFDSIWLKSNLYYIFQTEVAHVNPAVSPMETQSHRKWYSLPVISGSSMRWHEVDAQALSSLVLCVMPASGSRRPVLLLMGGVLHEMRVVVYRLRSMVHLSQG